MQCDRRPRVYVLNDTGLNYKDAERYGDIVRLTVGTVPQFTPNKLARQLKKQLGTDFDEKLDYLLLGGGNHIVTALVFMWISLHVKDPVKVLLYDAKTRLYADRLVDPM